MPIHDFTIKKDSKSSRESKPKQPEVEKKIESTKPIKKLVVQDPAVQGNLEIDEIEL